MTVQPSDTTVEESTNSPREAPVAQSADARTILKQGILVYQPDNVLTPETILDTIEQVRDERHHELVHGPSPAGD
jgi:hypothetical protein